MKRPHTVAIMIALVLCACDIPRDPEGTLERVSGATMHVGVTHHPPWVQLGDSEPTGVEVQLVRHFAEEIDAEIEWVEGSEEELFRGTRSQRARSRGRGV